MRSAEVASSGPAADETAVDPAVPPPDRNAARRRLALIGLAVLVVALVPRFVVQPVTVQGDSMRPMLHDGDHVLIDRITYRLRAPRRGEVVTTPDPRGRGTIVKRVVAVGGETVGIADGRLVVNGRIVDDPHADQEHMDGYFSGPFSVPVGFVYLLGDNRFDSVDSRSFGPVRVSAIDGRIVGHG